MDAPRLPLPAAYQDPAFLLCLGEAVASGELIAEFDRLYCAHVSDAAQLTIDDMRRFSEFVHDAVYLRLPDEAIHDLRAKALSSMQGAGNG